MLDCVQKNKAAICVSQLDESLELESRQQLNPQDWEKITAILTILSPVLYCTKAGEGDGVAISEVIPLLKRLNLEINSASGTGVQLLKKSVLNELKRYFVTTYGIETRKEYAVATVLDPRFKTAVFQSRENSNLAKLMVLSEMQLAVSTSSTVQDPDSGSSENQNDQGSASSVWDKVFDESGTSQDEEDQEDASRIELQNYLKEKRCPMTTDPLSWWRVNRNKYPVLSKLVRRFHSCPPGSAASERLFSTAKNVAGTKRLSLKPENLERLLFLKFNLRSLNGEKRTPTTDFEAPNSHVLSPPVISDTIPDDETSDIEIVSDTEGDEEM